MLNCRAIILPMLLAGCSTLPGTEANKLRDAETRVRAILANPDSAQFSRVAERQRNVCGLVNAKNSEGQYVGDRAFIVNEDGKAWVMTVPMNAAGEDASRQRYMVINNCLPTESGDPTKGATAAL